jgi:hypothetical protein
MAIEATPAEQLPTACINLSNIKASMEVEKKHPIEAMI